jgi:DNA-binding transcriptional LysR family regulator
MDLRQLRQFSVLAEELSFRRAAARLHMTQPPLSAAIRRLEEAVGVQLLARSRQHVALTPAGATFLEEARRVLVQTDVAIEAARQAAEGRNGLLRLATVPSAGFELLPSVLQAFNRRHPNVSVHLTTGTSGGEIESLRRGETDLAILVPPTTAQRGLEIRPLKTERMMLALSVDHPIARRRRVCLSELAEEPLVLMTTNSPSSGYIITILLNACQRSGFYPRIQQEVTQLPLALALVAAGMCVAVVSESMRRVQLERLTFVELVDDDDADLTYPLAFALRKGESPNIWAAPFMEVADEAVANGSAAMPASDRGRHHRR